MVEMKQMNLTRKWPKELRTEIIVGYDEMCTRYNGDSMNTY